MSKKGKRKHDPQRTCVGCRAVLSKRTLVRIVRTSDGIQIDPTGKIPGRGAYLHDKQECWDLGLSGSIEHALKMTLSPKDNEILMEYKKKLPIHQ